MIKYWSYLEDYKKNMISRKLFGPPGTGKTTKLLKYVKTFLKLGTPIDKIGYFAFTTKAANEAVDRMLDYHTAFQKKDLKHFRTLHSLAFNQLGMKKAQVMQDEHYEDIGRILGIEVTVYSGGEETTGFINSDSEYFNLINAARIKNMSIEEEYNTDMYSQDMDKRLLQIISDEVDNYKRSYGLVDFTDMIEKFIVSGLCPKYDVAFINGNEVDNSNLKLLIRKYNKDIEIFESFYRPTNIEQFDKNEKYLIFSVIGNPENFKDILLNNKLNILEEIIYPDHYNYTQSDLDKIKLQAKKLNARIITTEKDFSKININKNKDIKFLQIELYIKSEIDLINYLKVNI